MRGGSSAGRKRAEHGSQGRTEASLQWTMRICP